MVQKIKKTNNQKSPRFFLFFVLFLAVCAAVVLGLLFLKPTFENKGDKSEGSSESTNNNQNSDNKKEEQKEEGPQEITPEAEKSHAQYEGEDPNTADGLTGIINYAGVSEGNLVIRVSIEQSVNGACVFTLTSPSGKTINGSSAITLGPTSAYCSLSTPATESGTWKISVAATTVDRHGIITGEANI